MLKILNKIKENNKIIITRHIRPDGDCVGATLGLKYILKETYPDKEIYVINDDYADYLDFLGKEDDQKDELFYSDALVIVIDTANDKRISNKLFSNGKEIIKIDHHIETCPYGVINWVEEEKSSACEMITEFYILFKDELKITKEAATALYTGIVTDSGRFKFASVNGDTLRNASVLLDQKLDVEYIFSRLYLKDFKYYKLQAKVLNTIKMTDNGVAYIYVTNKIKKKFKISMEEASALISTIDSIRGSIIWVAFIDNDDSTIRVRLRSRFVEINKVAEKYRGGGHAQASGATLNHRKEIKSILNDLNVLIKEYKGKNENCL